MCSLFLVSPPLRLTTAKEYRHQEGKLFERRLTNWEVPVDTYLRTLLIQGAKSAVMTAHKREDPISKWAHRLREKSGWQKAVVALANKNARILWAMFVRGKPFDARHVSVKPGGAQSTVPLAGMAMPA